MSDSGVVSGADTLCAFPEPTSHGSRPCPEMLLAKQRGAPVPPVSSALVTLLISVCDHGLWPSDGTALCEGWAWGGRPGPRVGIDAGMGGKGSRACVCRRKGQGREIGEAVGKHMG